MKILTLISSGLNRHDLQTQLKEEAADKSPRISLYQRELNSDMLDESFLQTIPKWRKIIYKFLPIVLQQVIEAYLICHRYDLVVTWAERLAYPFAFLLKITNRRVPHITLNSWISNPKKYKFLKLTISHIDRILLWSSVQKNFALNNLKIPESKIEFIRKFADQKFFRPIEKDTDIICAVGSEMRDYPTLVEALRGTNIPCHIATGWTRGKLYETVKALYNIKELPSNITIGPKNYHELRELYARSRFVVVPILPTDTDNGLTCILESMAMGKAVICSKTVGQVDVIQDGVTGIYVPVQDPIALREAIQFLWNNPHVAKKMGMAGRKYLEEHHTFEQFIESMRIIIEKVVSEYKIRKKNL